MGYSGGTLERIGKELPGLRLQQNRRKAVLSGFPQQEIQRILVLRTSVGGTLLRISSPA